MAVSNKQKKVTEHFFRSVTTGDRTSKGDRTVTEEKIVLSPRKYMYFIFFFLFGDRVTEEIETIVYIYNRVKRGKTGNRETQKHNIQQNAFFCHSVTSTAFSGVLS